MAAAPKKGDQADVGFHGTVVKAYEGRTPAELAQAPVWALKGVSKADAKKLNEALQIDTIGDMAANSVAQKARGIVILSDAEEGETEHEGKSWEDIADGPLDGLPGARIGKREADLLEEAFRIRTVRDLAKNRFFRVARGIAVLAREGE